MAINKRIIRSNDEGGAGLSFNTVTYTGTGATNPITGVGFQPDLIWVKRRNIAANHYIVDTVRGNGTSTYKNLSSNTTDAEATTTTQGITNSTIVDGGFTMQGTGARTNASGDDYVAWCWKAGGAAVTNTDGTITSQVSANPAAGFSVVGWQSSGSVATVGHGLGVAPNIVITKKRQSAGNWNVYSSEIGNNKRLFLNKTDSEQISSVWGDTDPTNSVFTQNVTTSTENVIAYCFAEVAGFSKFGSYDGNAGSNSIVTGFEPAFVMLKRATGGTGNWFMHDNKRLSPSGYSDLFLTADTSDAEIDSSDNDLLFFNENGFTLNTTFGDYNAVGSTYIYMAFANQF